MTKEQKLEKHIAERVDNYCSECDGTGFILIGSERVEEPCDFCEGSGISDITLEDVLIAINPKCACVEIKSITAFTNFPHAGSGYECIIKTNLPDKEITWVLGEPLLGQEYYKQSQQTINFLLEIFENE